MWQTWQKVTWRQVEKFGKAGQPMADSHKGHLMELKNVKILLEAFCVGKSIFQTYLFVLTY